MLPAFDGSSGEPLHRQLRNALTVAIEDGHIRGDMPSTRALAADLGVSRNTVNAAYMELVAEGFIEATPRVGYRVNDEFTTRTKVRRPRRSIEWRERLAPLPDLGHVAKPDDWVAYRYPFVSGQPDPTTFPMKPWLRAAKEALADQDGAPMLSDHIDKDDNALVDELRKHILPGRGISARPEEILITAGTQHGVFLIGQALVNESSRVAVEEPGYPDARHIFARRGAQLIPLPVDEQGVVVHEDLASIDVAFVTPSHHYPSNATLAIGRRHQLLSSAVVDDFLIIEDDYDSEFRYVGRPTPALKALDDSARVAYVGSFSKFLAPGLRIGFVVADAELVAHLRDLRRYEMRHTPWLLQRTMANLIRRGDYTRAVRRTRMALKAKWTECLNAVNRNFDWDALPTTPTGGTSLWLSGPPGVDMVEQASALLDHGIVIERGDVCFLEDPRPTRFFKLGYGAIPIDSIAPGVAALGRHLAAARP